ncbi:MAG: TIGR01244 family phosphatase [Tateyamaria sp.]|jgi:uncharacterized protein (TIGR01244 family)|nr:TIGR01244 family phosphatase [Tateyamaria sp.]
MDIRTITPSYSVAPQIEPADMEDLVAAGFTTIINNRPDEEVPPSLQADIMEAAAKLAGLAFVRLPLTHQTLTPQNIRLHADHVAGNTGPVLAYCASGTRSTIVWALGQAGAMPVDDILAAARTGGYNLDNLRATLDAIANAD